MGLAQRPLRRVSHAILNLRHKIAVMLKWRGVAWLVLNLGWSAATTCPCVEDKWVYQGKSYSYCNNPNGVKTSWCPTALNDDGTYTSDLPFVFCEGEIYNTCEDKKDAQEKTPCPCAPDKGGEWKYGGQSQLYCADPSSSGFLWCATETTAAGEYKEGKYAKCTEEIQESCEALEDAEPESICPCVAGGQWSFDGEPQSYCQKPNGIGRASWCPREASVVTTASMSSTKKAYCEGKVLKACQRLEGTRLPPQCPCVDGGQFTYKNKQYSYCEKTRWCATEVGPAGEFIGKFAKCKKSGVRKACHALHELTTDSGNGQQCYDSKGMPSSESLSSGDVSLSMAVSNNYYVYPHNSSEFPTGPGEVDLVNNIT